MDYRKDTGNKGENIAANYLLSQGFIILKKNWRHKHWEVDLIASKNKKLHFIEVKTRRNERFGKPEASIGRDKMKNLKNAAEEYLYQHPEWKYIQFDVVAIILNYEEVKEILLIEDVYF
jgi:putative endonuclease